MDPDRDMSSVYDCRQRERKLVWNKHVIGASLSELNTSMTALYKCVCSLVCGHLNIFLLGTFSISQSLNLHVYTCVQLKATVKSLCQSAVSTWKRLGLKTSQAAHSCTNYIYTEVPPSKLGLTVVSSFHCVPNQQCTARSGLIHNDKLFP